MTSGAAFHLADATGAFETAMTANVLPLKSINSTTPVKRCSGNKAVLMENLDSIEVLPVGHLGGVGNCERRELRVEPHAAVFGFACATANTPSAIRAFRFTGLSQRVSWPVLDPPAPYPASAISGVPKVLKTQAHVGHLVDHISLINAVSALL